MKFILLVFAAAIVSCQSTQVKKSNLNFDYISSLVINESAAESVLEKLGNPDIKLEKDDFYSLNYNDKDTGFQRLIVNISKSTNKVIGYLWIPFEGELETRLESLRSRFPSSSFTTKKNLDKKSHNVRYEEFHVDEKSGISISVNPATQNVQVISRFSSNLREKSSRGSASTNVNEDPYSR